MFIKQLCIIVIAFNISCSIEPEKNSQLRTPQNDNSSDYKQKCKTELNILNGSITKEDNYKEVSLLHNKTFCSGSWISKNLFLTAAHCITEDDLSIEINGLKKKPLFSKKHPKFKDELDYSASGKVSKTDIPFDLALLWFEDNLASATAKICDIDPKRNDRVTIVGYGYNTSTGGGKVKRQGVNNIRQIRPEGIIELKSLITLWNDSGLQTVSGPGDSGSPMYSEDGCILGSVSSGSYGPLGLSKESFYVNLQSESSMSLLDKYELGDINSKLPDEYIPDESPETAKEENEDSEPGEC